MNRTMLSMVGVLVWLTGCDASSAQEKPTGSGPSTAKASVTAAAPGVQTAAASTATGTLTVTGLQEAFKNDEKSWMGKKVRLEGVYFSTSTASAGGKPTIDVSVAASQDDIKHTVGCEVAADPGRIMQYTPVVIEGTVAKSFGPTLKNCTLTLP